jgi:purine-binding chemotaxis protein CheW
MAVAAGLNRMRIVTFRCDAHLFAADILAVERVLRNEGIRSIPDMPAWMEGVIDHDRRVVPVIDLRRRFGLSAQAAGPQSRLLVCTGGGVEAALRVDAVLDVRPVAASEMNEPPALFRGLAGSYLKGLTRREGQLVVVLDLDQLLATGESLHLEAGIPTS